MEKYIINHQSKNTLGKKTTISIILTILFIFIIIFYLQYYKEQGIKLENKVITVTEIQQNILSLLPLGLLDINISSSTPPQIIQNGTKQTIIYSYASEKPVIEVINSFKNFILKNKNWSADKILDQTKIKTITSTNSITKNSFHVTITPDDDTRTNRISLTYIDNLHQTLQKNIFDNFPTEDGVTVNTQDSSIKDPNGSPILSRSYASKITLDDNYILYTKYLTSNGWRLSKENLESETAKYIVATKNNINIFIKIPKNPTSDITVNMISITITLIPKT